MELNDKIKRQDVMQSQSKATKIALTENKTSDDKQLPDLNLTLKSTKPTEKSISSKFPETVPDIANVIEVESQSSLDNPGDNAIYSEHGSNLFLNVVDSASMKKTAAQSSASKTKPKKSQKPVFKRKMPFSRNSGKPSSKRKLTSKFPQTSSRNGKRNGKAVLSKQASILSIRSLDRESIAQEGAALHKRASSFILTDDLPDSKRNCDIKMTASDELHELTESYNSILPYFKKDNLMAIEQRGSYAPNTTEKTSRKSPNSARTSKKYNKASKNGKKMKKASKTGKKTTKAGLTGRKMKKASKTGNKGKAKSLKKKEGAKSKNKNTKI